MKTYNIIELQSGADSHNLLMMACKGDTVVYIKLKDINGQENNWTYVYDNYDNHEFSTVNDIAEYLKTRFADSRLGNIKLHIEHTDKTITESEMFLDNI